MDGPGHREPGVGDTEVWEFYNTTADAHPMHVHEVAFEVVNRQSLVLDANGDPETPLTLTGAARLPEPWETGFKDTVIAYPGEVTRVKAHLRDTRASTCGTATSSSTRTTR